MRVQVEGKTGKCSPERMLPERKEGTDDVDDELKLRTQREPDYRDRNRLADTTDSVDGKREEREKTGCA